MRVAEEIGSFENEWNWSCAKPWKWHLVVTSCSCQIDGYVDQDSDRDQAPAQLSVLKDRIAIVHAYKSWFYGLSNLWGRQVSRSPNLDCQVRSVTRPTAQKTNRSRISTFHSANFGWLSKFGMRPSISFSESGESARKAARWNHEWWWTRGHEYMMMAGKEDIFRSCPQLILTLREESNWNSEWPVRKHIRD